MGLSETRGLGVAPDASREEREEQSVDNRSDQGRLSGHEDTTAARGERQQDTGREENEEHNLKPEHLLVPGENMLSACGGGGQRPSQSSGRTCGDGGGDQP